MKTLDICKNYEESIAEIILDEVKNLISEDLKSKLMYKSFRKRLLEKHGEKAFLNPDKLKYPVINEKGKIDKKLLKAAYLRSKQLGETDIANQAKELMREHGEIDVPVIIVNEEGQKQEFDLAYILDLFELDFSAVNKQQSVKTVFRDPEGEIIVYPGDTIRWTKVSGETCQGEVKQLDGNVAIVDVDGEEQTVEL